MRRFADETFSARDIELDFHAPALETHAEIKLGADVRREVYLILKESVNNAVKHAECTEASIEFTVRDGWLNLRVSDNGKRFDSAEMSNQDGARGGHGLLSMRQRAERLGGSLVIESHSANGVAGGAGPENARHGDHAPAFEQGTTVTLRVPHHGHRAAGWKKFLHKLIGSGRPL